MLITLLTDFGTADGYVAEVKGTLLRLAPGAQVVDVTHDIPPGDVRAGAYVLGRAWQAFPDGTVHVTVVDPGVGTSRRALAVESASHRFVGPDNGVLTEALAGRLSAVVELAPHAAASRTFHGRDLFAPAAAALARGVPIGDLGVPVADPVRLPRPPLVQEGRDIVGIVVHVDRFGTLITNIPGSRVKEDATVRLGAYDLPLRATFGDVPKGDPVAFIGSAGTIEIAAREARADTLLGASRDARVRATARPARTRDS